MLVDTTRAHEGATPAAKSSLELAGTPLCSFEFSRLPSINDFIREANRHSSKGSSFEKHWRALAHRTVEGWITMGGVKLAACRRADGTTGVRCKSPLISANIFVVFKVWKSSKQVRDSAFNLYTKPIEDGITDSGLWPGDDDRYVKGKTVLYCGLARAGRVTCEIHHIPEDYDGNTYGIRVARANVLEMAAVRDVRPANLKRRAAALDGEAARAEEAEGVAAAALSASRSFCGVGRGRRRRS